MRTVTGKILIPEQASVLKAVHAVVRVRDVSRSDSRAAPVAESRMVVDVAPEKEIRFRIDVPDDKLSGKVKLNLEVHIDLDGSGYFSPGDLVSMQPHRILPDTREVDVPVSLI